MSAKGSVVKRTKNVRNLDSDDVPLLEQSIIDKRLNIIPVGRQLQRTPPSKVMSTYQPNKPGDSPTSEQLIKDEPCAQEITKHVACMMNQHNGSSEITKHSKVKEDRTSIRRSGSTAASATPGHADPEIFIQGMQGYQWTDADLEFVYQTKWKKQVEQLQQELSEVQKSLKATRQLQDVALAAHDKIQTELSKVSSCERVQEMSREILLKSQSCDQLEGLNVKGLLARLKVVDVQRGTSEERRNISKLKEEITKAQTIREKQKLLTKDIDICNVNIDKIKVNVHTLTADIAALESRMSSKMQATQSAKPRQRGGPKPPTSKPFTAPKARKPTTASSALKASIAPKHPTAPSAPKPSTALKAPSVVPKPPKGSVVPKPPKGSVVPKPPTASKASVAPKPPTASKASVAPKPPTAPKVLEGDVGGLRRSKRIAAKKEK